MPSHLETTLQIGLAQIAQAAAAGCALVTFGEALAPGYPFWTEHTDGARFNSDIFAEYAAQAVQP